jgi:hypothetical protein
LGVRSRRDRLVRPVDAGLDSEEEPAMNKRKTLWAVLLAVLCVPTSGLGIVLGFMVGCVIAMILQGIFAPGEAYDYYSVGTPVGNVAILGPVAIGAALPWIAFGCYVAHLWKRRRPKDKAGSEQDQQTQQESAERSDHVE